MLDATHVCIKSPFVRESSYTCTCIFYTESETSSNDSYTFFYLDFDVWEQQKFSVRKCEPLNISLWTELYNFEGPAWLSGQVFDSKSRGPGFEPHRILRVSRGCVLGRDTLKPQLSTDETRGRHE